MATMCGTSVNIFQDAINHCRWKTELVKLIDTVLFPNMNKCKGKTFQEIIKWVNSRRIKGVGPLTIYDLTNGIGRHFGVSTKKVYIIGGGPWRAVKLLGLRAAVKKECLDSCLTLHYVEIPDVIKALESKGVTMPLKLKASTNGDDFETFICKWQKTVA